MPSQRICQSIILVIVPVIPSGGGFTIDINSPLATSEPFIFACSVPQPHVSDLIDLVLNMNLTKGLENSLTVQLEQAEKILNDDNPDNDNSVCDKLDKFIHHVNIKAGKGLTSDEAQLLLDKANAIKEAMNC